LAAIEQSQFASDRKERKFAFRRAPGAYQKRGGRVK